MFNAVAAAAEKVAGTAVLAGRPADTLCNVVPFRWKICFAVARKDRGLTDGISGPCRILFIGAGLLVAYQAVDPCLVRKIKIFVFPSITGVARCATSLVALDIHSEVIDG